MTWPGMHTWMTDLYDAALDAAVWHDFGVRLAAVLGGQTSGLWVEAQGQFRDLVTTVPAEAQTVYQQYYHARDPYATTARHRPRMVALLGQELVPPQVVLVSEYYHDYCVPFGICHVVGATAPLHTDASAMLVVAAHRPHDMPAFTEGERQRLNTLLPHLQRATQLRQRLGRLEAQAHLGYAALEALPLGVIVAEADGTVMFANPAAEAMAQRDDGLRLGGRRHGLGAMQPLEAQTLRAFVYSVTHGGRVACSGSPAARKRLWRCWWRHSPRASARRPWHRSSPWSSLPTRRTVRHWPRRPSNSSLP